MLEMSGTQNCMRPCRLHTEHSTPQATLHARLSHKGSAGGAVGSMILQVEYRENMRTACRISEGSQTPQR